MTLNIGHLKKLKSEWQSPINYYFRYGDQEILLNTCLRKTITLTYTGNIYCIQCGRKTNKSFQQGYCFPCLRRLQECQLCIIHPERCLVERGRCSDHDWAHAQCNQPHIVYLANSSGLKVGITRDTQVPARWIDQGAIQALTIFKVKNRYQAGMMEVALKQFVADRTNWRGMLKNQLTLIDLITARNKLCTQARDAIEKVMRQFKADDILPIDGENIILNYPVLVYPQQVSALSFDKTSVVQGELLGMKGQYLIFEQGVLNVRKFAGYEIQIDLG